MPERASHPGESGLSPADRPWVIIFGGVHAVHAGVSFVESSWSCHKYVARLLQVDASGELQRMTGGGSLVLALEEKLRSLQSLSELCEVKEDQILFAPNIIFLHPAIGPCFG